MRLLSDKAGRHFQKEACEDSTLSGLVEVMKTLQRYGAIYMSKTKGVSARVRDASYVITFLRLWHQHTKHTKGKTLTKNFLTSETYKHLMMSCHCAVNIMRMMRDLYPLVPYTLEYCGTDICETLFSRFGGMENNKRVYTVLSALRMMEKMNMLSCLYSDNPDEILRMLEKRKSPEWKEDIPKIEGSNNSTFSLHAETEKDEGMIHMWKQGMQQAWKTMHTLGLWRAPFVVRNWWQKPWEDDGTTGKTAKSQRTTTSTTSCSSSSNSSNNNLFDVDSTTEDEPESEDFIECKETDESGLDISEAEINHATLLALNTESIADEVNPTPKLKQEDYFVIDHDGNRVHKAQVLATLRTEDQLSADRTIRYKEVQKGISIETQDLATRPWRIKQGDDACALFEVDGNNEVWYGNVLRILRLGQKNKRTELYNFVDLNVDDGRKGTENLIFIMKFYTKEKDGTYSIQLRDSWYGELEATQIVCPVDMHVCEESGGRKLRVSKMQGDVIKQTLAGKRFWSRRSTDEEEVSDQASEKEVSDRAKRQRTQANQQTTNPYQKVYASSLRKKRQESPHPRLRGVYKKTSGTNSSRQLQNTQSNNDSDHTESSDHNASDRDAGQNTNIRRSSRKK